MIELFSIVEEEASKTLEDSLQAMHEHQIINISSVDNDNNDQKKPKAIFSSSYKSNVTSSNKIKRLRATDNGPLKVFIYYILFLQN